MNDTLSYNDKIRNLQLGKGIQTTFYDYFLFIFVQLYYAERCV